MCNKCESIYGYINPVSNKKFILEYSQELLTLNQHFMGGITEDFIQLFGGVDLKPSMISTIRFGQIPPIYNLTAHYMNLYGCDFSLFQLSRMLFWSFRRRYFSLFFYNINQKTQQGKAIFTKICSKQQFIQRFNISINSKQQMARCLNHVYFGI